MEWGDEVADERIVVELVAPGGEVIESAELAVHELESPPTVTFSGRNLLSRDMPTLLSDPEDEFQADGDYPILVSQCGQEAVLSWALPAGVPVEILEEGRSLGDLPSKGSIAVTGWVSRRYVRRGAAAGTNQRAFPDRELEIRRYPSLSLVLDASVVRPSSVLELGASVSRAAGEPGLTVVGRTSDDRLVPPFVISVPPGATWATTRIAVGDRRGRVTVTGLAKGYVRDAITFEIT